MEFFEEVPAPPGLDEARLKNLLSIDNLTLLCDSINQLTSVNGNNAEIYCLWGAFSVRREEIRHGVRYSLLNCPHALAWTITWHEHEQRIIIHCTIDSREEATDPEFAESIDSFLKDWSAGINKTLKINE